MTSCSNPTTNKRSLSLDNPSKARSFSSPPQLMQQAKYEDKKTWLAEPIKNTKTCADYELPITHAVQAHKLEKLEDLLFELKKQADCPPSYLESIKQSMAQIVAARADDLTQQGQLTNAESWLRRAPTMVWGTQVVYGDIAARRHQWQKAAQFYHQTLDLIADPELTPQVPSKAVIKKIHRLAYEAQLLAGNFDAVLARSKKITGTMRGKRDIEFKTMPIPVVQFNYGQIELDKTSKKSVQQLATYLNQQNLTQLTLIGHTDSKGGDAINHQISKQRAVTVKKYLQQLGVTANIMIIGKGETEPLQLANLIYTPDEIDALNRRVEFLTQ